VDRFEQLEIEARLKEVLGEAKAAYESSKQEYLRALECREDLGGAHPDGARTYKQARRNRDATLGKYNQALIRFNRFILDGKVPEGVDVSPTKKSSHTPALSNR
jgi:hypothetical protein